ncbi:MAG: zinc dependent phospholipase C family protein [Ardenticatenaceae bacterium]|nr:zinc dependent phospholipase C family protein [Ardenticatenaceae bacterium]
MPTPFMHLHMVQKLRAQLEPHALHWLEDHWPAFYLGNIAPDFQAICNIPRDVTHFYSIPPEKDDYGAFDRMLERFPELRPSPIENPNQAAFVLGYGIHLHFDLLWDHRVLTPRFREGSWLDRYGRFTAHNILLTYLDREAQAALTPETTAVLKAADATSRLPFDPECHLKEWQSLIVTQLQPESPSQTIAIYAKRMRMPARKFQRLLDDPDWMRKNVFERADLKWVEETLSLAVTDGLKMVDF